MLVSGRICFMVFVGSPGLGSYPPDGIAMGTSLVAG